MRKVFIVLLLVAAFFFSRLTNLTLLPIFTDEAIYIRWTQIAEGDAAWRFISLTDGKQPLFVWLAMFTIKYLADPLLAGRLISVFAGLGSLAGIYFLTRHLFSEKQALLTTVLYLLAPFFLFHDRLALMDSLLTCFMIWGIYLEILLAQKRRLDVALLLGMVIGAGSLTKSSAFFLIYFLPLSLVFFDWKKRKNLFHWIGLVSISFVISQLIYAIQRLSPFYHMVNLKNQEFIYSFSDFFSHNLTWMWGNFIGNFRSLFSWTVAYLTLPIVLLVSLIFLFLKKKQKERVFLFSWFLLPLAVLAAFGKVLYPRFTLFMTFPLLLLASFSLEQIKERIKNVDLLLIAYCLFFAYPLYFDSQIIFNPLNMPLPKVDRNQYLDDWPSGYGISEVVDFLKKEAEKGPLFVATEGTFGLTPYALEIYLQGNENIKIQGYWPISDGMEEVVLQAKKLPTFLLLKDTQEPREEWPVELIKKYQKGRGEVYMGLYRVGVE